MELASLPFFALHPDPAAVRLDGELAERQSEPGASHAWRGRRLRLLELSKDDLVILLRNSRPVVGDGKQHAVCRGIVPRAEPDLYVARGMRERVLDEVGEHALDETLVGVEHWRVVGNVHRPLPFFLSEP